MIKATLELTDEQLLDVVAFVKNNKITAVFDGALLLEVGEKYLNRKGDIVPIECEEYGQFRSGAHLYYANGRHCRVFESELDLIEEVEQELPFEMVVGGVYKQRNGGIEEIVHIDEHFIFPFNGKSGCFYTLEGRICLFSEHEHDLIERIR